MSLHKRLVFHNSFKLAPILVACMLASVWAQIRVQGGTSNSVPSAAPTQYPGQVRVDFYMTPQEAALLLGAVDEIISFDSKVTGPPTQLRLPRRIEKLSPSPERQNRRIRAASSLPSSWRTSRCFTFRAGQLPRRRTILPRSIAPPYLSGIRERSL